MALGKITDAVKKGRMLVSDGAWGTTLLKMGLRPGECPEAWNLNRFETVKAIAQSYIEAGADMVETNSFGGNYFKLKNYGLEDKVAEINEAAARASLQAANGRAWVLGSMGPSGKMLIIEEVTEQELYEAFKEQAQALERGGVNAICIETMSDGTEAEIAVRAAKENTRCEVICTFTFDKTVRGDFRTMMGLSPRQAVEIVKAAGADIAGTNCGHGMEDMAEIVRQMREAGPELPLLVHANAGLPVNVNGEDVYPESPETMAGYVKALVKAGANIIGGCCGTTPEHIRKIKAEVGGIG